MTASRLVVRRIFPLLGKWGGYVHMATSQGSVTALLAAVEQGDEGALNELYPLVEQTLRTIARNHLRNERPEQAVQTTILIHDAFLRLVGPDVERRPFDGRLHFYRAAARVMRHLLIDYARRRDRGEAYLKQVDLELSKLEIPDERLKSRSIDCQALDEALAKLGNVHSRQNDVIELRYFCGFTIAETAEELGISASMVKKETRAAKAWLHRELTRGDNNV